MARETGDVGSRVGNQRAAKRVTDDKVPLASAPRQIGGHVREPIAPSSRTASVSAQVRGRDV